MRDDADVPPPPPPVPVDPVAVGTTKIDDETTFDGEVPLDDEPEGNTEDASVAEGLADSDPPCPALPASPTKANVDESTVVVPSWIMSSMY